jgi:hypothetical protein
VIEAASANAAMEMIKLIALPSSDQWIPAIKVKKALRPVLKKNAP